LWVYQRLSRGVAGVRRWLAIAVLGFMFSVLLWAGPEYDGYWLALGMWALLILVGGNLREGGRVSGLAVEHGVGAAVD
jgi:hypothetical protein